MEDDTEIRDGADGTPESLLPYDQWMEDALRAVVVRGLSHVLAEGLPGEHHFYITFRTDYPGVAIPARLRQKYPAEMTIVLQHQFRDLFVDESAGVFGVNLSFGGGELRAHRAACRGDRVRGPARAVRPAVPHRGARGTAGCGAGGRAGAGCHAADRQPGCVPAEAGLGKARPSFLKKRSKKTFISLDAHRGRARVQGAATA